jgi:gliding motility-associated protein GldL
MNFAYGMEQQLLLLSSFKITHFELGPLTGTVMLSVGLLTEALFCAFCFEPVDDELDWTLVYPELTK